MILNTHIPDPLNNSALWRVGENGELLLSKRFQDTCDEYIVEDGELAKLHKLLPDAVRMNVAWANTRGSLKVSFDTVQQTLHVLNMRYISLPDVYRVSHIFTDIKDITQCSTRTDVVAIKGTVVEVKTGVLDDSTVHFVTECTPLAQVNIPCDYLNKMFPGWRQRFDIATSLGISKEELLDNVFITYESTNIEPGFLMFD